MIRVESMAIMTHEVKMGKFGLNAALRNKELPSERVLKAPTEMLL